MLGVSGAACSRRSAGQFREVDRRGEKAIEDDKLVQRAPVAETVVIRSRWRALHNDGPSIVQE